MKGPRATNAGAGMSIAADNPILTRDHPEIQLKPAAAYRQHWVRNLSYWAGRGVR